MSALDSVRGALAESRFETARRIALDALGSSAANENDDRALRILSHRAHQALGDFVACRDTLETVTSNSNTEHREVLLLQAGDFTAYAQDSHYRKSQEAREGYSLDEFLKKYRLLAAKCQSDVEAIPAPQPAGKHAIETNTTPARESGKSCRNGEGVLRGRLTFPDGSPVAEATVTLGGPLSYTAPHPYESWRIESGDHRGWTG